MLATQVDEEFGNLLDEGEWLTDYGVDVRYPLIIEEPSLEETKEALRIAEKIKSFVLRKLPQEYW